MEATKFTEVGFHGRDVDMIIRDLLDNGIFLAKKRLTDALHERITNEVKEEIIALITNSPKNAPSGVGGSMHQIQMRVVRKNLCE